VDDNAVVRLQYKGLMDKLEIAQENSIILGATYQEIADAARIVLNAAGDPATHKQVICIFDQNLDTFPEGKMFGTDIVSTLVEAGFSGPMFIRSDECSFDDICLYLDKGATGILSKTPHVGKLAVKLLKKCNLYQHDLG